ncbi:MAG: site-specific DNA-methyltransferase [candidate division NC10 bacterium]|nr:site-specific DNA-methyltransferase [candidate division NC10 bacterium]
MGYEIVNGDCFAWLGERDPNSIHAVVTDPPFGLLEYSRTQMEKMRAGRGGVWRIPPSIGGAERKPLPRFTVLSRRELNGIRVFFEEWGGRVHKVLVPGGAIFIASNPLVSPYLCQGLLAAGLERRGEIVRLVRTLRGGDRPKNAEREFPDISVMPRSCYEPWLLFRKPISEQRVSENLRKWATGGLRRTPGGQPFPDVLRSETPPDLEVGIAPHPSLKPQRFMRQIVWGALPLGKGVVLDPFMGSGSTLAAAEAVGYESIGVELDPEFVKLAKRAIPKLAALQVEWHRFEGANGNGGGTAPREAAPNRRRSDSKRGPRQLK